jgi:hypothetical protein
MSGPQGNWGPYPTPRELQLIGFCEVEADGTVVFQSGPLGAISKPSTGNYQFEPPINIIPRLFVLITQKGGPGLTYGIVTGLGPDSTWIQVQFNNPVAVAQQDCNFTAVFYQAT